VRRFSNEFKVGLLALVASALLAVFIARTDDRPGGAAGGGYTLYAEFPSAAGLYPSSQIRIAGVSIGSVRHIELAGPNARVTLEMDGAVKLPVDSYAELNFDGILGDKTMVAVPGSDAELLADGDTLQTRSSGPDFDKLSGQVEDITDNIAAITKSLRGYLEDDRATDTVSATLENIRDLSQDMAELSANNRAEVNAIARNLREVSETLNRVVGKLGGEVEGDAAKLRGALEKLESTMGKVESIADKIDRGEGTIGALVNDDEPVRQIGEGLEELNASLLEVGDLVATVSRLRTDVEYRGQYLFGSQPADGGFENPYAGGTRHRVALRLIPRPDFWYLLELVDHPLGTITYSETSNPTLGSYYSSYVRTYDLRYTAQFVRRFRNTAARLGLYESSGGVGLDQYLLRDRLLLSANLYDFTYGSWPLLDGTPNLSVGARLEPAPHLYLEGGLENTITGLRYGYFTAWAGAGFHFSDDDIKWLISVLPSP